MAKLLAHQMLGLATAYFILRPESIVQAIMYGFTAIIGSTVPDLDAAGGHRRTLHNMIACILTGIAVYTVLLITNARISMPFNLYPLGSALSYIVAYITHILADIPTGNGVALFYPLSKKRVRVLGLRYDNVLYNGLLMILSTILLCMFFAGALPPYKIIRAWYTPHG
ncbi:MAG: metal-dependent hydrolase [Crenarchaeota archaeon]|nr:metal-dependent hydrolase [Thermoproteota archaeon]